MQLKTTLIPVGVLAVAIAGCGSSNNDQSSASTQPQQRASQTKPVTARPGEPIKVTLNEWGVSSSAQNAKAGKIPFVVHNAGKAPHEMVVIKTDKTAAKLGNGTRVSEAGNVGEAGDVPVGATKKVTIKLKPGHYALICNLPGHYKMGMHTDLTVR